jgi:hypothetical protein
MGAALVSTLLDYWDPAAYGMVDLVAELEFMHAESANFFRRNFIKVDIKVHGVCAPLLH